MLREVNTFWKNKVDKEKFTIFLNIKNHKKNRLLLKMRLFFIYDINIIFKKKIQDKLFNNMKIYFFYQNKIIFCVKLLIPHFKG